MRLIMWCFLGCLVIMFTGCGRKHSCDEWLDRLRPLLQADTKRLTKSLTKRWDRDTAKTIVERVSEVNSVAECLRDPHKVLMPQYVDYTVLEDLRTIGDIFYVLVRYYSEVGESEKSLKYMLLSIHYANAIFVYSSNLANESPHAFGVYLIGVEVVDRTLSHKETFNTAKGSELSKLLQDTIRYLGDAIQAQQQSRFRPRGPAADAFHYGIRLGLTTLEQIKQIEGN